MRARLHEPRACASLVGGALTVLLAVVSDLLAGGLPEHLGLVVAVVAAAATGRLLVEGRHGGLAVISAVLLAQPALHTVLKVAEGSSPLHHAHGQPGGIALLLPALHVAVTAAVCVAVALGSDAVRVSRLGRRRWRILLAVPVHGRWEPPRPRRPQADTRLPRLRVLVSSLSHRGPPALAA